MNKIEQAAEATRFIANCFNSKSYCMIEIHKTSFFHHPPQDSRGSGDSGIPISVSDPDKVMLDGTVDMNLYFGENMWDCFGGMNAGKGGSIQRLHGFSESYEDYASFYNKYTSLTPLPLISVTTLHLRTDGSPEDVEILKNVLRKSNNDGSFHVGFYSSLDTADIIVLINSSSYNLILELLESIFQMNSGVISNTHVGYLKDRSAVWKEDIDRCSFEVALKDISKQDEVVKKLCESLSTAECKTLVQPYSKAGIYDMLIDLRSSNKLTSSIIVNAVAQLNLCSELLYNFTVSIEKKYDSNKSNPDKK